MAIRLRRQGLMILAGLFALLMLFALSPAFAMQHGSAMLAANAASCSPDAPIITSTRTNASHAYMGMAYQKVDGWRGALLKYPIRQGVMVGADGEPLYANHQATVRPDVWASGHEVQDFGTEGRLMYSSKALWVSENKESGHAGAMMKIGSALEVHQLVNHSPDERAAIAQLLENWHIGAVMYPSDGDDKSGMVLYTDTQGVLRLVDDEGRERLAYLPMSALGKPYGIDAAWQLHRVREYHDQGFTERLIAVGGFGRSAEGLVALDVTDVNAPRLLYHLTSAALPKLSHIYAPVSLGYVRQNGRRQAVFVFGGGMDLCYQDGVACHKTSADGAAVYAINALTGESVFIWQDELGGYMKHSFVAKTTLVDRYGDGTFEYVYAADLGGQIFRMDVNRAAIVRVFAANADDHHDGLFDKGRQRFYQQPIISLYDTRQYPAYPKGNRRFALISITSSDQLPLVRDKASHVYGIFDDGLIDLKSRLTIRANDLIKIDDDAQSQAYWLGMAARAKGWMRVLSIDGDTHVTALHEGVLVPSGRNFARVGVRALYHLSVAKVADCLHQMTVQPQVFCLPFGVCAHHRTGQLLTHNTSGVLTAQSIQGNWQPTAAKSINGKSLAWQVLMPYAGALDLTLADMPVDGAFEGADRTDGADGKTDIALVRILRFLRWYDVRSSKD